MAKSTLIQYVRDINNNPIATLVAVKDGSKFQFGWSKYSVNREYMPFSKKIGKQLAYDAIKCTNLFILDNSLRKTLSRKNSPEVDLKYIPRDIEPEAAHFVQRASKYFNCEVNNVQFLTTLKYKTE